ncbi:MAG: WD40 repeat domain-containing protein [Planctomycetaceae bacterium]|nr:WD40 repeat domain-containing protein [Planctomycetaceae bacterium]
MPVYPSYVATDRLDSTFERAQKIEHPEVRAFRYSPDGKWLAITGKSSTAIWRTSDWTLHRKWDDAGAALAFSPDGEFLAIARGVSIDLNDKGITGVLDHQSAVVLRKVSTGDVFGHLVGEPCLEYSRPLAFTPDSKCLLLLSAEGKVQVFDVMSQELRTRWDANFTPAEKWFSERPRYLKMSPSGRSVYVACKTQVTDDAGLKCWDIKTGKRQPVKSQSGSLSSHARDKAYVHDFGWMPNGELHILWNRGVGRSYHTREFDASRFGWEPMKLRMSVSPTGRTASYVRRGLQVQLNIGDESHLIPDFTRDRSRGDKLYPQVVWGECLSWHPRGSQLAALGGRDCIRILPFSDSQQERIDSK